MGLRMRGSEAARANKKHLLSFVHQLYLLKDT